MARLSTRIRGLFEQERAKAQDDISRVLRMMTRADKALMLDGFSAEFRGEPEPEGFAEAMDRFEKLKGFEAMRRFELFETETDRARNEEFRRRMARGEDWKEITR